MKAWYKLEHLFNLPYTDTPLSKKGNFLQGVCYPTTHKYGLGLGCLHFILSCKWKRNELLGNLEFRTTHDNELEIPQPYLVTTDF